MSLGDFLVSVKPGIAHSSLAMTLRYAHLSPDHKKKAVDILGQRIDIGLIPKGELAESNKPPLSYFSNWL